MLKRVHESRHSCRTPTVVQSKSPMLLLKRIASGLVIEVFDDSDKVGADVVLLHGCSQSCIPNPVEGLPEVYEDMVETLLVLEIFGCVPVCMCVFHFVLEEQVYIMLNY